MRTLPALPIVVLTALLAGCEVPDAAASGDRVEPAASQAARAAQAVDGPAATIDNGFTLGREDAPVAVVEFSDFGCPYCGRFARTTFPDLRREYVQEGVVRWRYVPVTFGFPGGEVMGAAAVCAGELAGGEGFWRAHDALYRHQIALRGPDARPRVLEFLSELGLDPAEMNRCMDAPATARTLAENTQLAGQWYINGTPSFVVNGVPMSGALPTEFFEKVFATVLDPSGL